MTTTTLKDRIYDAQDITFESVDGVAQTWSQDLSGYTLDISDPVWTTPGGQGSRTGWFKLTVQFAMSVTISYTTLDAESYIGVYSWDGITTPVEVYTGNVSSLVTAVTSGIYLIGFSLAPIEPLTSNKAASWADQTGAVVTKPTGVVLGDTLLVFLHIVPKNPVSTITPPAGWALEYNYDYPANPGDSTVLRSAVYSKTATGSEPASYSFGIWPVTGYNIAIANFKDSAGVGDISFLPVETWNAPTGADGVITTSTVSTTGPSTIVACFMHSTYGPGTGFSTPTGLTAVTEQHDYYIQQGVFERYASAAGTYGPYTSTMSSATGSWFNTAPPHGAFLVAIPERTTTITPEITITRRRRGLLTMGVITSSSAILFDEPFQLGSFLLDSVEPFLMETIAAASSSVELFNLSGPVSFRSEEPFALGQTLLISIDEPFIIIGTEDVYIGAGSPAAPQLGWRQRS